MSDFFIIVLAFAVALVGTFFIGLMIVIVWGIIDLPRKRQQTRMKMLQIKADESQNRNTDTGKDPSI